MSTPLSDRPWSTAVKGAAATALTAMALTACSGSAQTPPAPSSSGGEKLISKERCAKNEAAGEITFITGFGVQASAGILEEVAAADLGYYRDLCLDVTVTPGSGNTAANASLVASGRAKFTSVGNETEVLVAHQTSPDVVGVATLGHVPIATLMTLPDITDLKQLDGTTIGTNGGLPAPIQAMLVKNGVDVGSLKQVDVKFQKDQLVRSQVQSLTGYRSNEPAYFKEEKTKVTQWNPEDYGIPGSFAAMAANTDFLREHPTAAQDFVRASLHAFEHCSADESAAKECVDLAAKRDTTGTYQVDHNLDVWRIESGLVEKFTPEDQPIGFFDPAATKAAAADAVGPGPGQLKKVPDVAKAFDGATMAAIHDGTKLVWPAP